MSKVDFTFSSTVFKLFLALSERLGEVKGMHFASPSIVDEKSYKIASNKAFLNLLDVDLSSDQVHKLSNHYLVKAPQKDIEAARQLILVNEKLENFSFTSLRDFQSLYRQLEIKPMSDKGLSAKLPELKKLFTTLQEPAIPSLIKAISFPYDLFSILPFEHRNLELALYWQKRILIHYNHLFRFLDYESFIVKEKSRFQRFIRNAKSAKNRDAYFALMLKTLNAAVEDYLIKRDQSLTTLDRIDLFTKSFMGETFTRQIYMRRFKFISAITASRDLRFAVESARFIKKGDKRLTSYSIAK